MARPERDGLEIGQRRGPRLGAGSFPSIRENILCPRGRISAWLPSYSEQRELLRS